MDKTSINQFDDVDDFNNYTIYFQFQIIQNDIKVFYSELQKLCVNTEKYFYLYDYKSIAISVHLTLHYIKRFSNHNTKVIKSMKKSLKVLPLVEMLQLVQSVSSVIRYFVMKFNRLMMRPYLFLVNNERTS